MSQQVFTRTRLMRAAGIGAPGFALLAVVLAAGAAAAAPPVVAGCIHDSDGANDVAGETDVTRSCASAGASPFELDASWSVDHARLEGVAIINVCALYDTDADGLANAALCTSLRGASGTGNGNALQLREVKLYSCTDEAADRCSGAAETAGAPGTSCSASQDKQDPFPGPSPGPGWQYPEDTVVRCQVDAADFGLGGTLRPLDACSYAIAWPDTTPSDCLLFRACASAEECDDGNPCTTDSCTDRGVCRRVASSGAPCSDGVWCNGDETCTPYGACGTSAGARRCEDGVECTLDHCDEISDSCRFEPRNSFCSDGLFCTGVETCDPLAGCRDGAPPNCTDGIACTGDACDEENDGCTHEADEACEAVIAQLEAR